MGTPALTLRRRLTIGDWLRVSARIAAMAGLLLVAIPLFYLWRVLGLANPWPRIFLGGVTWIAGVQIVTSGTRAAGPTLLIANHVSWIDIPALSRVTGCAFVGHDGLAAMPLLKWLCKLNDTVFVARHDRTSVARQVAAVRSAVARMHALAIFPEGTTSDGTGVLPFKSALLSAFEPLPAGVAVQPVALDYGVNAGQIAWIGDEPGLDNFLRIVAARAPLVVTVRFMPPLAGADLASRKTMAAAARHAIAQALAR